MIKLALVLPCYNEEEVIEISVRQLTRLFNGLISGRVISKESMMVFVNDGSKDRTWEIITSLHEGNSFVRGISLAGNVGHQNAIMAGMMAVRTKADAVITIDADLQDDLRVIPEMIAEHTENHHDIVYAVKTSRKADPLLKRMTAAAFYRLQRSMGIDSVFNHADFRLLSRRALDMLSEYGERNLYLRGLIPMIGLPSTTVEETIRERQAGKSKYTLKKMLSLSLDGITSFSKKPIYLILYLGVFFLLVSVLIGVYVLHAIVTGTAFPGWSSIMLSIWLIGGLILLSIGVVGVYIGKIYTEVKNRPLYHVKETLGDDI